jgi:hypothetical protein
LDSVVESARVARWQIYRVAEPADKVLAAQRIDP